MQIFAHVEAPPRVAEKRGYARLTYPTRRSETDRLTDPSKLHVTRARVTAGAPKIVEHGENARTRNTSYTNSSFIHAKMLEPLFPSRLKTRFWSRFQKANTLFSYLSKDN